MVTSFPKVIEMGTKSYFMMYKSEKHYLSNVIKFSINGG